MEKLSSDDPTERETAADELAKAGESARTELEKAVAGTGEARARARELLARLDRERRGREFEKQAGPLGKEGLIWVAREGFELAEDMLPEFARRALSSTVGAQLGLAIIKDGRISESELALAPLNGRVWALVPQYSKYTFSNLGKFGRDVSVAHLFRLWPTVRASAVVFVIPPFDSDLEASKLRAQLVEAFKHERTLVRAAAVHLSQRFPPKEWAASAFALLKDRDPLVRKAALDSLWTLPGNEEKSADDLCTWWERLMVADREDKIRDWEKAYEEAPGTIDLNERYELAEPPPK